MQFTPQQMSGGQKYSSSTRIGNWYEDKSLDRAKLDEFQERSSKGSLQLRKLRDKVSKCTQQVPHSYSDDGFLRYGDTIILQHDQTSSTLACDPFDEIFPGTNKFHVTASPEISPIARNTFRILRPPAYLQNPEEDPNDPVLRIGQSFCLGCNESLLAHEHSNLLSPQLFLCSTLKNERTTTRTSNKQIVYLTSNNDAESIWLALTPSHGKISSSDRVLSLGSPVFREDSYTLTHRQTNTFLTVDSSHRDLTDFGSEYECFAAHSNTHGKLSFMISELQGTSTASTLVKADIPNNFWHFVLADDPSISVDNRRLPPVATVESIFDEIYSYGRSLGLDGFTSLRAALQKIDKSSGGDGKLDKEDVKKSILQWGCPVEPRFIDMVLDAMNKYSGFIDYREFFAVLRGPFSGEREEFVRSIFSSVDSNNQTAVLATELWSIFRADYHPLVQQKMRSEIDIINEFKGYAFKERKVKEIIRLADFEDYCGDISATVGSDDEFARIMNGLFSGN